VLKSPPANNAYSTHTQDTTMKSPVRVTITGAAGQIGYQLAFRIASGQMLGSDQPVILQLLEIPPALPALNGVVMELDDCAFTTLAGIVATDDPDAAFKDSDYALLVGARPRGPGMERKDLLEANAAIFSVQGTPVKVSLLPIRFSPPTTTVLPSGIVTTLPTRSIWRGGGRSAPP